MLLNRMSPLKLHILIIKRRFAELSTQREGTPSSLFLFIGRKQKQ